MATKKIKIQDAPTEGNFTKEEIQSAIKVAKKVSKKNIDPGRPISRPMAPANKEGGWGKTLSKEELLAIVDRVYAKQEEKKNMSKLSDTIKAALDKKRGITHTDGSEANATVEKKVKVKSSTGPAKKPPTRSAGRGR